MSGVREWLESLGLEQYVQVFDENDIDLSLLPQVDDQALKDIGVKSTGHRLRLRTAITRLGVTSESAYEQLPKVDAKEQPLAHEGERRQLTVMFCDMVGFTELASRVDPEVLQQIIRVYEDTCAAAITRYEGYVFQRLGDGIVAFFGYPLAHEGEAERAIRAGLDIIDAFAGLDVPDAGRLQVRIGIATGMVVIASAERGAVGETMNLASRLQGFAQVNTIVVSERVQRLAGGSFVYHNLGKQTLKGIAQPTHAYAIVGVSDVASRFEAASGNELTPLVGRDLELGLLMDRWALAQDGEGQVVLLSGEPGIGKSRILSALRERLQREGAKAMRFQCSPYYVNSAFWPSIDNFERTLKFARDESPESKLDKLESLIVGHYQRPLADVRFVAGMLSIPCEERYGQITITPQKFKDETLRTLVDLTEAAVRKQPSVMLFEDVHWADPTTLEVLDLMIDRVKDIPLLIVLTHRPEFQNRWADHGHVSALNLSKLTRAQSSAMVERVARGKALPPDLLEQIIARTDGVPLFVEELTKSILESGELTHKGDRYDYAGGARSVTIPATLRDSLMARLDRYAPVKEIAQIGAAIGREFSYELISAVAPLSQTQLDDALTQLTDSGLAFRRGSPPEATYTFKHALVQDAAYDSLLKSRRQELHGKIAEVIEKRFPNIRDTEPEVLAHHFAQAGQNDKAFACYEAAGQRSLARIAMAEAVRSLGNALDILALLPHTAERDRAEVRIRLGLATALMAFKGWAAPEVGQVLLSVRDICVRLDDADSIIVAQSVMAMHKQTTGELTAAYDIASELLETGAAMSDPRLQIVGGMYAAGTSHYLGMPEESVRHAEALVGLYRHERDASLIAVNNQNPKCWALWAASYSFWELGRYREARAASEEQLEMARTIAHPWNLAWGLTGGSDVISFLGDWDRHVELIAEARELGKKYELPFVDFICDFHEGFARISAKDFAAGEQTLRQGLNVWEESGGTGELTQAYTLLAEALTGLGRYDNALSDVIKASEWIEKIDERHWEPEIYRVRGEIDLLRDGGSAELAEAGFRRALDISREKKTKTWELRAATSLAKLWQRQGRPRQAHELLTPVYEWFQEGIETPDLLAARALLEGLE